MRDKPPIVRTTEIIFDSLADMRARGANVWDYDPDRPLSANLSNPTVRALEKAITALEGGHETLCVGTGQAAISTVFLSFAAKGDTVLVPDNVYGPVKLFCENQLKPLGIATAIYDPFDLPALRGLAGKGASLLYMETPGSHTFETPDIAALAAIGKESGIPCALDNTFFSPVCEAGAARPIEAGADIVLHSLSKIVSGTASVYGGSLTAASPDLYRKMKNMAVFLGHWLAPDDASVIAEGMETLPRRLEIQRKSMRVVLDFLESQPETERVFTACDGTRGASLFSITLRPETGEERIAALLQSCRVFRMSLGWGGPRSLIVPVNPKASRALMPLSHEGQMLRLYVGREDAGALAADLHNAFTAMREIS